MTVPVRWMMAFALMLAAALSVSGSAAAGPDDICGVWQQHVIQNGKDIYMLTVHVKRVGSSYETSILRMSEFCKKQGLDVMKCYNHRYNGQTWEFDSDWHRMGIAHFKMTKVTPTRFQGWSYLKGRPVNRNIWIKESNL